jgi:hypothetical protein
VVDPQAEHIHFVPNRPLAGNLSFRRLLVRLVLEVEVQGKEEPSKIVLEQVGRPNILAAAAVQLEVGGKIEVGSIVIPVRRER